MGSSGLLHEDRYGFLAPSVFIPVPLRIRLFIVSRKETSLTLDFPGL